MSDDESDPDRDPEAASEGRPGSGDADGADDALDALDDAGAGVDDPFAELGAAPDASTDADARAGDATEAGERGPGPSAPANGSNTGGDDPFDDLGFPDAGGEDPFDDSFGDEPFGDRAGGRSGAGDEAAAPDDLDDAFERMDVSGPAEEDVWEALDADAGDADAFEPRADPVGDAEHVVSKRAYCQQCPHFSSPPEVACAHDGTTIVEAIGFDEFRVRNCPMISEEDPTFERTD